MIWSEICVIDSFIKDFNVEIITQKREKERFKTTFQPRRNEKHYKPC